MTDGFSGNIALKTAEGVAELIFTFLKNAYKSSMISKIGYFLSKPAINRFKTRIDPRKYNGAVLLGLNGIVVKSHGGTDAFGFCNAISVAVSLIEIHMSMKLRKIKISFVSMNTKISAFGHFAKKIYSNNDLKKLAETSDEWIYTRTGIRQRHIAEKNELTSNLAINAALNAFDKSENAQTTDRIIIATTTPDGNFPATATKVQNFLSLTVFLRSIYKLFAQLHIWVANC